jgi:membrane carboxypeptidase/penicillin-binding protein
MDESALCTAYPGSLEPASCIVMPAKAGMTMISAEPQMKHARSACGQFKFHHSKFNKVTRLLR